MTKQQVQVLFTKYVFLNDIEAVKELGDNYHYLKNLVTDVANKYERKIAKLNSALRANDLEEIEG